MSRLPRFIATAVLIAFLVPYIVKLRELPLLILLVIGVAMAIADFYFETKKVTPSNPAQGDPKH